MGIFFPFFQQRILLQSSERPSYLILRLKKKLIPINFSNWKKRHTVLPHYIQSLFAFIRELYPWGNFPGNVQNQSINQG